MIYVVLFQDNESHADRRREFMADHLAFLERNSEAINAAGPLVDSEDGGAAGGMWIVSAEQAGQVRALIEADPFWPTGLRKSVRILEWTQVFAEGRRRP